MQHTFIATGIFTAITKYNKMKLLLEDADADLLKQFVQKHNLKDASPIEEFEGRDGKIRHVLKIKLPPKYLKIARNYDTLSNLIDCRLSVTLKSSTYDFEKDNKKLKGWIFELSNFKKLDYEIPPPPPLTRQ